MMTNADLTDPFNRLLAEACSPQVVRAIEAGASAEPLWSTLEASGYLDALVPEEHGGAGLALGDVAPLLMAAARHAIPCPVGEVMVARALLAEAGIARPSGPIVLVGRPGPAPVPLAQMAHHALVADGSGLSLVALDDTNRAPSPNHAPLSATLSPAVQPLHRWNAAHPVDLEALGAVLRAAAIAGAADRLLEMTVDYANQRVQFGKPIGRQQAIQQQLAVMAEQAVAMRIAAATACMAGLEADDVAAAVAKQIASRAASQVADIAHAVHGAIGIAHEHDLQLYTRRLREWRLADGAETYWAERLGRHRLRDASAGTIGFVRTHVAREIAT